MTDRTRNGITSRAYARELAHSRRVRRLKVVLPVVAGVFMLALVGRSVALSYMQSGPVSVSGAMIEDGRLIMANPKMGGFTAARRPYEMTAARAIQALTDSTFVDLEEIAARLPVGISQWAAVESATGTINRDDNMLHLTSPTVLKTTDGLVARLRTARLDMGRGDVTSDDEVEIETGEMKVTADSMMIRDGGERMVFERRVKVVIDRSGAKNTGTAGADDAGN